MTLLGLRSAVRHLRRRRGQLVRAALRVDYDDGRTLCRRLRDVRLSRWLSQQVDALLRRGDCWAHEVEQECERQLGSLMQGPTNPASCWRGATGRLRGIPPGAEGLRDQQRLLMTEARAAGYSGRRPGGQAGSPPPDHWLLHGAIAAAAVALWDLGVVRRRLRAGWPAGRALTSLVGLARRTGRGS